MSPELIALACPHCHAPIKGEGTCEYCGRELRIAGQESMETAHRSEEAWVLEAQRALDEGKKIAAIKIARRWTGIGLKDAKELIESGGLHDAARLAALPRRDAVQRESEGCFPAGTMIDTPGGRRAIETLRRGDEVWSWCAKEGARVASLVSARPFHGASRIWELEVDGLNHPLRSTGVHRLLTERGWCLVSKLVVGDLLVFAEEHRIGRVRAVRKGEALEPVYNLWTTGEHSYIVEGIVAHNFTHFAGLRSWWHRRMVDPLVQPGPELRGAWLA